MLKKIYNYIQGHLLLRNITVAVCLLIVVVYVVSMGLNIFTRHGQKYEVPDFGGKTVEECAPLLSEADLKMSVIDSLFIPGHRPGEILDQSPQPKMTVKSGRNVFVVINSHRPRMEAVPYVTGYSLRQAKNMLETKGFEIRRLKYVDDVATNNVVEESVNGKIVGAGSNIMAELGTKVDLTVGQNPSSPLPIVPKVIGLTLREAKSRLWEAGLNVGDVIPDGTFDKSDAGSARVWRQVPNQQERSMYGTSVSLSMTVKQERVASGMKVSDEMSRKYAESPDSVETE